MSQPTAAKPSTPLKKLVVLLLSAVVLLGGLAVGTGFLGTHKLVEMQKAAKARGEEMKALDPARPVLWGQSTPGNAWDDYKPALDEVKTIPGARHLGTVDASPEFTKASVAAHSDSVVGHLRRGASRATSRLPYEWEKGASMPAPVTSVLSSPVAMLAILRARGLVEEGKSREAQQILLDVCQFGRDVGADGVLVSETIGLAVVNLAVAEIRDILASGRFDSSDDLAHSLGILDANLPRHDRALLNDASFVPAGVAVDSLDRWGPRRMLYADAVERVIEWLARAGKSDALPWPEAKSELEAIEGEAERTWNPISEVAVPSVVKMSRWCRERKAQIRIVRIAAHFLRTGEVIEQDDPFGKKIQTKRTGDALKIWSIGADGFDNLGVGDWKGEFNDIVLDVVRK